MNISKDLLKHRAEFSRALRNHNYEVSESGIFFPGANVMASGVYTHDVNGKDERIDSNIVVTEGLNSLLDVALHDATKIATWYFRLFSANTSPLATWTAANFTANATEITSGTEGYSEATGQAFVEAAAAAGAITNSASKAAFTIVRTIDPAAALSVWGAGLLSNSTKGGTTGTLMSASKFSAVRTLYNTDVFNLGYTLTLTST
jgi:hypothetical protein